MGSGLDDIDRGILYHLQLDAHQPISDIADAVGVANNTVRNRIRKLQETGVIQGFTIDLDYGRADIQHHYLILCTVKITEREHITEEAAAIPGIVRSMTVMTGQQNVLVEVVAASRSELFEIASSLFELGLRVEREHLIWSVRKQAYSGFNAERSG